MPIKPDGEVYFNVTVYKDPDSDVWTAESFVGGNPDDEGLLVDLFPDIGHGETPGEALEELALMEPSKEAVRQIERAEEVVRTRQNDS